MTHRPCSSQYGGSCGAGWSNQPFRCSSTLGWPGKRCPPRSRVITKSSLTLTSVIRSTLEKVGQPLGVDRPCEQHQILELHALFRGQIGHRAPVAVSEEVGGVEALVTDPLLQGEGRRPASGIRVRPCPLEALVVDVEGGLLPLQRLVEITPRLVPELFAGPGAVGESCGLRLAAPLLRRWLGFDCVLDLGILRIDLTQSFEGETETRGSSSTAPSSRMSRIWGRSLVVSLAPAAAATRTRGWGLCIPASNRAAASSKDGLRYRSSTVRAICSCTAGADSVLSSACDMLSGRVASSTGSGEISPTASVREDRSWVPPPPPVPAPRSRPPDQGRPHEARRSAACEAAVDRSRPLQARG